MKIRCAVLECGREVEVNNTDVCEVCGKRVCLDCMRYADYDEVAVCVECSEFKDGETRMKNKINADQGEFSFE